MNRREKKFGKGNPDYYVNPMTEKHTKVAESAESSEEDVNMKDIVKTLVDAVENMEETAQDMQIDDSYSDLQNMGSVDVDEYDVPPEELATMIVPPEDLARATEMNINPLTMELMSMCLSKSELYTPVESLVSKNMGTVGVDEYDVPPEELAKMTVPPEDLARATEMNIDPLTMELMSMCLSKSVLYTPVKGLVSKYPQWLEEHKSILSAAEYNKRVEQFELLKNMCSEYEKEESNDSDEVKTQRLKILIELMHKVRCCGDPPTPL